MSDLLAFTIYPAGWVFIVVWIVLIAFGVRFAYREGVRDGRDEAEYQHASRTEDDRLAEAWDEGYRASWRDSADKITTNPYQAARGVETTEENHG